MISLQSKGLSRVFSNTRVQKHRLFSPLPYSLEHIVQSLSFLSFCFGCSMQLAGSRCPKPGIEPLPFAVEAQSLTPGCESLSFLRPGYPAYLHLAAGGGKCLLGSSSSVCPKPGSPTLLHHPTMILPVSPSRYSGFPLSLSSRLDLILFAFRIFFFFFFNIYLLGCAGSQLRQMDCCGMWDLVP